jgi:hypothetical protein
LNATFHSEEDKMGLIRDDFEKETLDAWRTFVDSLDKSLAHLERDLTEAEEMRDICTDEWCQATEHYIDDIGNALFSISEPRWSSKEDSKKIKDLKRRLHDIYAKYKGVRQPS